MDYVTKHGVLTLLWPPIYSQDVALPDSFLSAQLKRGTKKRHNDSVKII